MHGVHLSLFSKNLHARYVVGGRTDLYHEVAAKVQARHYWYQEMKVTYDQHQRLNSTMSSSLERYSVLFNQAPGSAVLPLFDKSQHL
jgi:hypothetical protein